MAAFPGAFGITRKHFEDLDGLMDDLKWNSRNFSKAENILIHMLAMTHKGLAMKKSAGPADPQMSGVRHTGRVFTAGVSGPATPTPQYAPTAWRIPVRRITGEYFRGWKVKKLGPGTWMTYNDSREAFFIEFGINPRAENPVPRPILKRSTFETIQFLQGTKLAEKFMGLTIGQTRRTRGRPLSGPIGFLP